MARPGPQPPGLNFSSGVCDGVRQAHSVRCSGGQAAGEVLLVGGHQDLADSSGLDGRDQSLSNRGAPARIEVLEGFIEPNARGASERVGQQQPGDDSVPWSVLRR